MFLTFQITRTRKYRFLLFKNQFLNTSADPPDPADMEHELRLATYQQRAGGQDDGSLNKFPQMIPNEISGRHSHISDHIGCEISWHKQLIYDI